NIAYNIPGAYIFEGNLDLAALAYSFKQLQERHEILRTIFKEDEQGRIRQFIQLADAASAKLNCMDLRLQAGQEEKVKALVQEEISRPFLLSEGPLLRVHLYQVEDTKWIFTYVMHHIISDGWSMDILINEMSLFYNAYVKGEE